MTNHYGYLSSVLVQFRYVQLLEHLAMPPILHEALCVPWAFKSISSRAHSPILSFLYPQQRSASILSGLSDNPGAYHKSIRRGRGPSSGKGKTSGRGHKGQKQHGKVPRGFNGGQTKDEVVHGIRGFENVYVEPPTPVVDYYSLVHAHAVA